MKMITRNFVTAMLGVMLLMGATSLAHADLQKGLEAYERGDYAEAFKEWRPLAEQGDADAQFGLGWMYEKGEGVAQDDAEAVRWYRRAAEQGNASAQYNLGLMYDEGQGVGQDDAEAVRWYRRAAEQGNASAQHNLGWMYDEGQGVAQDVVTAYIWVNLAAAQDEDSRKVRDALAKSMTPGQIAEGQQRVRACVDAGFKGC